jgi:hypothetical protein
MAIPNWIDRMLDRTFFVVNIVRGKVHSVHIIDECYSSLDTDLHYETLKMTSEEREEDGIYTARELNIDYTSIMDYNRYTDLVMGLSYESTEEEGILADINTYWHECAVKHFKPITRRMAALIAWERDPGVIPRRCVIEDAW